MHVFDSWPELIIKSSIYIYTLGRKLAVSMKAKAEAVRACEEWDLLLLVQVQFTV